MAWQGVLLFTTDNRTDNSGFYLFSWHDKKANKRGEGNPWTFMRRDKLHTGM